MSVKIRCHCGKVGTGYVPSRGDGSAFRLRKHATPAGDPCPWRYRTYFDDARGKDDPGILADHQRPARRS